MEQVNETIKQLLTTIVETPDTKSILMSLVVTFLLSISMWLAYRYANTAASYQPKFGTTLVALAFLSTILMDLIQSNLALSLGMLGSLSIVRFRTNIKDPRDIAYVFWSMAIGLASATQSYFIGFTGSLVLMAFMVITRKNSNENTDMMLVVRGSNTDLANINTVVNGSCTRNAIKAKNILSDSYELVYEVSLQEQASNNMIYQLFELGGVDSVNLLSGEKCIA